MLFFILMIIVTLVIVSAWYKSFPTDELEWVVAIIATLGCFTTWHLVIVDWLTK